MSTPAIAARDLFKRYLVHSRAATSLKELVLGGTLFQGERVPYVALDGVSFALEAGRSLAVIGSNGSGKSTLLKLLGGLVDPTSGAIEVHGKVIGLLELGAGFQPEFTGMENIFLQCAIMGLGHAETMARLGEIVAFAELDKFIHTPVKRYSSGMYVRLGFAIAAHVDADILLLDEVLAVGDAAFQRKCLAKMRELRARGKTIVFVSHSLDQVEAVGDQVLWLEKGKVRDFGAADVVLPKFYEAMKGAEKAARGEMNARMAAVLSAARHDASRARITDVRFPAPGGGERRTYAVGEAIDIEIDVEVLEPLPNLELCVMAGTLDALRATWCDSGHRVAPARPGKVRFRLRMEDLPLAPGRYLLSLMLGDADDPTTIHDLVLRLHAIAIRGGASIGMEEKLLPLGRF